MDPGKIFQIITNSTLLATRLLSGSGGSQVEFTEPRYCAVIPEDARVTSDVTTVVAIHKLGEAVKYSITGGNRDGLFSIDQNTGTISLAATLDYELRDKHELVVGAWASAGGWAAHAVVEVEVADVNDHAFSRARESLWSRFIEEMTATCPRPCSSLLLDIFCVGFSWNLEFAEHNCCLWNPWYGNPRIDGSCSSW
ncbi:putative neural-cadherin 2 [Penaeus japonicus]|uniref:putative neural-cadherin 2 n=1 Tax=Penaeus japonicus TaxID=27405 RepID=UPI001C70DB07|nr:putative neural-cadherin 2 [Penaeus japonicus]